LQQATATNDCNRRYVSLGVDHQLIEPAKVKVVPSSGG
jgi:hypothetical protein